MERYGKSKPYTELASPSTLRASQLSETKMSALAQQIRMIMPRFVKNKLRDAKLFYTLPAHIRASVGALKKGDVCIDCGANIGDISRLFARYGAVVHAFEPNPYAFTLLAENAARYTSIYPHAAAVGADDRRKLTLYFHENHDQDPLGFSQGGSLMQDKPNVGGKGVEVDVVNLADFISDIPHVKILKIDVEGFETVLVPALIAGKALDNVDVVYVETHDHKWSSLVAPTQAMKECAAKSPYKNKIFWDWP